MLDAVGVYSIPVSFFPSSGTRRQAPRQPLHSPTVYPFHEAVDFGNKSLDTAGPFSDLCPYLHLNDNPATRWPILLNATPRRNVA